VCVCVCVCVGQKRPGNNEISANVRGTGKLRRYYVVGGGGICSMTRDHVVFHRPSAGVMLFIIHTLHIYIYTLNEMSYDMVHDNCCSTRPYNIIMYYIIILYYACIVLTMINIILI